MNLVKIEEKVQNGHRLSEEDALALFETNDLAHLARLADMANHRKNGRQVFYNINRHINPTNICALSCKFCAFSRKPGEEGSYAYEISEMIEKAGQAVSQGATELHMVGGLHPRWPFKRYLEMITSLHATYPQVHLKAFTVVELDWMAKRDRRTIADVLQDLKDAGLGSLPGGGAEIFHPEIRDQICDTKVTGEQWIETHRMAHGMGLRSNCTMLYGHIEKYWHRVDHMRRLRDLQDETGGFNVFIPLAFQPFHNEMGIERYTFGIDDLKTIAVARLYLDNFKNIKSYWVMLGQEIAQLALDFGANDLDGTVTDEKISRMAGGMAGVSMTRTDLESIIERSNRIPVERDTLYRPINPTSNDPFLSTVRPLESLETSFDRVRQNLPLSTTDLYTLATEATLSELGAAVQQKHQLSINQPTFGEAQFIDLEDCDVLAGKYSTSKGVAGDQVRPITVIRLPEEIGPQTPSFAALIRTIEKVRHGQPHGSVVIEGMGGLVALAHAASMSMNDALEVVGRYGIRSVRESAIDGTLRLNLRQEWHHLAHFADLATTMKVNLSFNDTGKPAWLQFCDMLTDIRALLLKSRGLLGVEVVCIERKTALTSEYMRALALTRLALPPGVHVTAPLQEIPTMAAWNGGTSSNSHHPAIKLASVVWFFGAGDLGMIDGSLINTSRLLEDLRATSYQPSLRDECFNLQPINGEISSNLRHLRHVPEMSRQIVI